MKKFNSSRLLKSFELNESKLSKVIGGGTIATGDTSTNMDPLSSGTGTYSCPDSIVDYDNGKPKPGQVGTGNG